MVINYESIYRRVTDRQTDRRTDTSPMPTCMSRSIIDECNKHDTFTVYRYKRELPAVVDLSCSVHHRKSCTSAAAAADIVTDAGDVSDVSVVGDSEMRLVNEVVEIREQFLTPWKHARREGAEALCCLIVVDVRHERVPVVTQVELDVCLARVTLVDADELVVARIPLKEAA